MKDKLSADSKSKLESEIKKVEDALSANNLDQIKSATESLNKVWNEIASQLYQQAGQQQPGGQQNEPSPASNLLPLGGKEHQVHGAGQKSYQQDGVEQN